MGWSEKYKKSINCNNPKGFSQKAHCAGKKKNEEMVFEEITEDILNEKLITYGNRKPYGQVVFMAGGAGSGKGFAIKNFVDSASFKIRDVDEMKKQLQILNRLGKLDIRSILKKYGRNIKLKDLDLIRKIEKDGYRLQNLNLKNSDHVYALHIMVKAMGIKDSSLEKLLLGKNNPETLPNILFDITAKDVTDITNVIPKLKAVGYKPENIHLTWVLTNYVTAMSNNKNRSRMVPEDILLKTHEGAANTIWGLITKALPKGMNGRVDVILNNPENTVFLKGADGKDLEKTQKDNKGNDVKVKFTSGFLSLPLKKEKGGIYPEKVWKDKLFKWVKGNAPDSITANMEESMNEAYVVLYSPKKGVKPVTTAAYADKKDAEKWAKDLGGITMIVKKKIRGIDESTLSQIHKAAKKGSYPVSIVATMLGKVVKQELVKTPMAVPAVFRMMQGEYPKARISVESRTGQILFQEAKLNHYRINGNSIEFYVKDKGKNLVLRFKDKRDFDKLKLDLDNPKDLQKILDKRPNKMSISMGEIINEISAIKGLKQVVKGNTKEVEGIKVSKEMAQAMIDWFNSSPYGRKYPRAKNARLHVSIGIMLSFGLDRYAKHKGAKEELKYLKSMKESYKGSMSDFKYEFPMRFEDETGNSPKAIKKVSKKGKGYEVRTSTYMSEPEMKKVGDALGLKLANYQKSGNIAVTLYESVNENFTPEQSYDGLFQFKHKGKKYVGKVVRRDGGKYTMELSNIGLLTIPNVSPNDMEYLGRVSDQGKKGLPYLSAHPKNFKKVEKLFTPRLVFKGGVSASLPSYLSDSTLKDINKEYRLKLTKDDLKLESVNERSTLTPKSLPKLISKVKKQLMRKWKQKGGYENFGQKELSNMERSLGYPSAFGSPDEREMHSMLQSFDNWAMNYDGNMREAVIENKFAKKPEVTPKQLLKIQNDVRKVNKNIKVYISKHPVDVGRLNIELGHGHDNDAEIDKIYDILKKHTGNWRTGTMFNETVLSEGMFGLIDQIKQDSSDVRDFVKNIFADKSFKDMKNDKDFIKYLKSIYEIYEGFSSDAQRKAAFANGYEEKGKKKKNEETTIEERINLFVEKNVPTDPGKWSYYKAQAKKKFDVYPSAYANGWAAKKYKAAGGGWKKEK